MQENENSTNPSSDLTGKEQPLTGGDNQPKGEQVEERAEPIVSGKRVAKNAIALYFRMFISMAVGFYASRVILNVLGVDDYGINSAVGSIVTMMGFLKASMSGATSRFLTFELGRNDKQKLSDTFSSAMIIHLGIMLLVFVLGETVGLWFLENKMVIPPERMVAARWVYQANIIGAMLHITQVPYNAVIIAHEKMNIYAYFDILGVTLRLLILYLLVIGDFDKLILYSILSLSVSIFMMSLYRIYCIRHYPESHFHFIWRKDILKPMLSFSGWDLYGNLSNMARTQGVIVLVNLFFGLVANAAVSIAFTVQGIVMKFTSGISTAVRPQIVKTFSVGDYDRMSSLVYMSAKYLYLLLLLVSVPVFMETHFVLELWLKIVPDFTVWLVRWMIIFNFSALMSVVMVMGIHATGKVKRVSLINGTLYLSVIPVSYIMYKYNGNLYSAFIYNALAVFVGCLCNVYTLGLTVKQITLGRFLKKVLLPIIPITLVALGVAYLPRLFYQEGFIRFIIVGFSSTIVIFAITYTTAEAEVQELIKKRILKYVKIG
ncbi:MAG: polysaccharide biosynthesis protein [Muribaculaceae bacterium]|nr:polysaccharide biosynthesis protein [Muribaculaceae bacterium]